MKFKKHISFLLALFLLVSNTGFAIDVHYCRDVIASIKPSYLKSSGGDLVVECNSCYESKGSDIKVPKETCCKDKTVHFQKKSGKITLSSIAFQPEFYLPIEECNTVVFHNNSNFKKNNSISYYCTTHAPPLFKLFQHYIFYA